MMATIFLVNGGVTPATKRQEIFQRIVSQMLGSGYAQTINMMNMEILHGATPLASEIVALQGSLTIPAKGVIILGFSRVLFSLGILLKRFANLCNPPFFGTCLTMLLWPRAVSETSAAFCALKDGANRNDAFLFSQLAKVQSILLLPIRGTAGFAALLGRASGLVEHLANKTLALLKAIAGLTMGRQGTRLTSLQVGRSLRHLRSAIGAIKDAVFPRLHSLNYELSPL
jgi:hypothetical protein